MEEVVDPPHREGTLFTGQMQDLFDLLQEQQVADLPKMVWLNRSK